MANAIYSAFIMLSGALSLDSVYWKFKWLNITVFSNLFNTISDNVRVKYSVLVYYLNQLIHYILFSDLHLCDIPMNVLRFLIIYNVIGLIYNTRLLLKSLIRSDKTINTIVDVYTGATWCEREAWDGFGIYFKDNIDIRRILNDYGFMGHPMRKDFPLSGYYEQMFSYIWSVVTYQKIRFIQEFRYFIRKAPWYYHLNSCNT